jgi:glucose-6-phosphate 1-dehydrogenase
MKTLNPTTFVIFGATGDLAQKKLIPALFDLYIKGHMPEKYRIVGFSRKSLSDEDYRGFMKESLKARGHDHTSKEVDVFLGHGFYRKGDIDNMDTYKELSVYLSESDREIGTCTNKLFYLAVPPTLYQSSFSHLAASGLAIPCAKGDDNKSDIWTRVLVEKPFGNDLEEARRLDNVLGELFNEEQIFRIDHYLAKETVQNILTFRFANSMFEPIWNNKNVSKIEIKLHEQFGIRKRGSFYDGIGALRDVGQNHILQMLSLVAMEDPEFMTASAIRKARFNLLKRVVPGSDKIEDYAFRGQYSGYLDAEGVKENSDTETFFRLKLNVNNDRWQGVPFFVESGKSLTESHTEISVTFKQRETCACPVHDTRDHTNKVTFRIQPDEGISVRFWAKRPGFDFELDEKDLSFKYLSGTDVLPDAYERILFDCIRGDQTLFNSTDEIRSQWGIITPICNNWKDVPLVQYEPGSNPEDFDIKF